MGLGLRLRGRSGGLVIDRPRAVFINLPGCVTLKVDIDNEAQSFMSENIQICPCGSGKGFATCCAPVIKGERESQSAEELMRARYSAFATGAMDFVVATTHPSTRHEVDLSSITEWSQTSTWQGLDIIEANEAVDNKALVSFEARFTQYGKEQRHREKSLFEFEDGKWWFVTGDELKNPTVRYDAPKPGRNEPCLCGSGKKYKKCCGA
jgi:SEC-C motif domain protein